MICFYLNSFFRRPFQLNPSLHSLPLALVLLALSSPSVMAEYNEAQLQTTIINSASIDLNERDKHPTPEFREASYRTAISAAKKNIAGGAKLQKVEAAVEEVIHSTIESVREAEPPEVETVENEEIDDLFRNYIGPGVGFYQQPYIGAETAILPEVQASLNWGPIFATDIGAGSFIYGDDSRAAALAVTADFRSSARNDISELKDMDELQDVFNLSLISFVYGDFGRMGIALMKELNGNEGFSAIARWQYEVTQGKWTGSPRINLIWRNKDSANYVYGVQPHEATPDRPIYELDSSLRTVLSYELGYEFARNWQAAMGIEYSAYNDEVTDSPIVNEKQTFGFWLALRKDI